MDDDHFLQLLFPRNQRRQQHQQQDLSQLACQPASTVVDGSGGTRVVQQSPGWLAGHGMYRRYNVDPLQFWTKTKKKKKKKQHFLGHVECRPNEILIIL